MIIVKLHSEFIDVDKHKPQKAKHTCSSVVEYVKICNVRVTKPQVLLR